MYPANPGSNLFPADNAIAFLNIHDPQRIHFRTPDFRFPAPLQDAKLTAAPPKSFQHIAGNLAFSTSKSSQIQVFDLNSHEIIATSNGHLYDVQAAVKTDFCYVFVTQDGSSQILTFDEKTLKFSIVATNKQIWQDFTFSQLGKCFIFGGFLTENGVKTPVDDLFLLENKQLKRLFPQSVGRPESRSGALLIALNGRMVLLADGISSKDTIIQDCWIYDTVQEMWMQINRNPLRIPSCSKGFCQWRYKEFDMVSTFQGDYCVCKMNFPVKFCEMDWIRADRAVILQKCQAAGLK